VLSDVNSVLETAPGVGASFQDEAAVGIPTGFEDIDHLGDVRGADGLEELDRRLARICREQGPLRAAAARVASRVVDARGWERIGYARLTDYAVERLGLSGRSLQSLARVGRRPRSTTWRRRPAGAALRSPGAREVGGDAACGVARGGPSAPGLRGSRAGRGGSAVGSARRRGRRGA